MRVVILRTDSSDQLTDSAIDPPPGSVSVEATWSSVSRENTLVIVVPPTAHGWPRYQLTRLRTCAA